MRILAMTFAMAGAIVLGGCTAAERGASTGAAVGAVGGALVGNNARSAAVGAVGGAIVGGVLGAERCKRRNRYRYRQRRCR